MTWTYQQDPDFWLCYATDAQSHKDLFGIYFGQFPQFNTEGAAAIGSGVVAGRHVSWYGPTTAVKDDRFRKQTIIKLKGGLLMHIWIPATTEVGSTRALDALAHMHLQAGL